MNFLKISSKLSRLSYTSVRTFAGPLSGGPLIGKQKVLSADDNTAGETKQFFKDVTTKYAAADMRIGGGNVRDISNPPLTRIGTGLFDAPTGLDAGCLEEHLSIDKKK